MIAATLIILSLFVQSLFVLTNLVGLPGSIISIIFPLIWVFTPKLSFFEFLTVIFIVIAGEILEFFFSLKSGGKDKSSNLSLFSSILFSFILAIVMSPLFFGLGAVIGSFLGAFLGTFVFEYVATRDIHHAVETGKNALKGRFLGTVVKMALGIASVIVTGSYLL